MEDNLRLALPPEYGFESYRLRRIFAGPFSIAEAIQAIGAVSKGDYKSITVVGDDDIGWLAALSVWLFGLRILVCSQGGQELYKNYSDNGEAMVKLIFQSRATQGPTEGGETETETRLQFSSKTIVLQDFQKLLRLRPVGNPSGRVPWKTLFQSVFGRDFTQLRSNYGQTVASALGSAARLLRAIASAEEGVSPVLIDKWQHYIPDSNGRRFVAHLQVRFPELESLNVAMEESARATFKEARLCYEQQIAKLAVGCKCMTCQDRWDDEDDEGFCNVTMVETIIALGIETSEMVVEDGLCPKRSGVETFYYGQRSRHPVTSTKSDPMPAQVTILEKELGPFAYVVQGVNLYLRKPETCILLFTGYREDADRLAISAHGICAYWSILQSPTDELDLSGKVHVLPGTIEYHGKPYSKVGEDIDGDLDVNDDCFSKLPLYNYPELLVTESAEYLSVWYKLSSKTDTSLKPLCIGPTRLLYDIVGSRGWVACKGKRCETKFVLPSPLVGVVDAHGIMVRLVSGDPIQRCVAILLAKQLRHKCISRKEECLQCCMRTAITGLEHYYGDERQYGIVFRDDKVLIVSE